MKKILPFLIALLILASCTSKPVDPVDPPAPEEDTTVVLYDTLTLDYAHYMGDDYLPSEYAGNHEVDFVFLGKGVRKENNLYKGDGTFYQVYLVTDSVDNQLMVRPGCYIVKDTSEPMSAIAGFEPDGAYDGTLVFWIENNRVSAYSKIIQGQVDVKGDSDDAEFTMIFTDEDDVEWRLYYKGSINVEDYRE